MTHLEKKVDAVARCLIAGTGDEKQKALKELRQLMAQEVKPAVCQDSELEGLIRAALADIGVPDHIKGHRCLVCALSLAVREPELLNDIVKGLYARVAEIVDTTPSRVERAIRHAIETAWNRGDVDVLNRWFGNTINAMKSKPTNSEFIARVSNVLRAEV